MSERKLRCLIKDHYTMKRALIFDLGNTIYPVSSIAVELFGPLFDLMRPCDRRTDAQ